LEEAVSLARQLYDLEATASSLPSERDQNFLLTTATGERFILKIANALEDLNLLEAQNRVMKHLGSRVSVCPQLLPAQSGDLVSQAPAGEGRHYFVRCLSYLPGSPLGQVKRRTAGLLQSLGHCVGQVDRALCDFDHPAFHRYFHWDLAHGWSVIQTHQALLAGTDLGNLVEQVASSSERRVRPLLPKLRRSIIHNDANDYNVLVGAGTDLDSRHQQVTGLIDFGDMVYSYTVGDLAIATAYAILDQPDPLQAAAHVVQGYHEAFPLREEEMAVLFDLVCMRLCMSACLAAYQSRQRPDDQYLLISQQPLRSTLPKLARTHPRLAEATFRRACQLSPVPASETIQHGLQRQTTACAPVLGLELSQAPALVFDLSVGSPLIGGDPATNEAAPLTRRLFERLEAAGATLGVGQYDEARLFYTAPAFAAPEGAGAERRTVHLGLDLFAPAGTPVYAPLAGTIHAVANQAAPQDYGPVIILRHLTSEGLEFYTLYGHLSPASLPGRQAGQPVAAGEQIGALGNWPENGGWPPHLHFQIVVDLLELGVDFPGVCRASEREIWKQFCPDPNLIVGLPQVTLPQARPNKQETLAQRRRLIGPSVRLGYREPVKIVRGWRQYLYDETGRQYLDAYNNVPHVGHCHPRVVQAGQEQMAVLNTNTRYLHDYLNRYAERLAATLPDPLSVCFFVNSASEANELALRLARAYTGRREMIVLAGAYHGHTSSLIDLSPYKHAGPGGSGPPAWVHTAPVADVYRGLYRSTDPHAAEKYAGHILEITERLQKNGRGLAGFIAETCPSVGGQIFFPAGYLAAAYRHVRAAGGVCIADEVQTGYGRIGTHFYAFQAQEVVPDVVVLGKPIGNGHPIGAVVTTPEIAAAFDNGMEFFSTFGGNTVSCAIGLAVLEVMQDENLQDHAWRVGSRLLAGLQPFKERYALVGDVRGSGLFLGLELVRDRETLEPATAEASFISNRMRDEGILLGTDGPYHNVIKIRPPLPFTTADADFLVATLSTILDCEFGTRP
jgi:4-aminobutyrate aminotransferase-like enzyme/Ser/Thr protein kinase RdoA (MazF antagonist)